MNVSTYALLTATAAGLLAAAATVASARARAGSVAPRLGLSDALRGALAGGVVLVAALVAGVGLVDLDTFGVFHLVYLAVVVGAPLAAVVVAAAVLVPRRAASRPGGPDAPDGPGAPTCTRPLVVVLVAAGLCAPLGLYMTHVEPYWLSTEELGPIPVAAARSGSDPVRIAVLTDYQVRHIGDYEVHVVDEVLATRPDVVLLPGDVFQDDEDAFQRELPALRAQFGRLRVPGGAFLVDGDTDPLVHLQAVVAGTPVRLLDDEVVQTRVRDRTITIGGIELDYASARAMAVVHDLETRPGVDDVRILLAHRPDAVYDLPSGARTDLVVTGHTHGGQVAVPGFGPLMTLTGVPRAVAAGGVHELDGRRLFVGRGVGVEPRQAPQIRLFVRPQVAVLTLADA